MRSIMPGSQHSTKRRFAAFAVVGLLAAAPAVAALDPVGFGSVAQAAVPAPDATGSVIAVQVRGDQDPASGTAEPLAGVQLQLHADNNGSAGAAVNQPWAVCTSDADGDCAFSVPDTGGENEGRRFWVQHLASPDGWFAVNELRTGKAGSIATSAYAFQTPPMAAGVTFTSGTDFMATPGATANTSSNGLWQQSRDNPAVPDRCGLRVALVLDLSYSIDEGEFAQLKRAGVELVDALEGTPSAVAVYTFADSGPAAGARNDSLDLTSVATAAGADTVRSKINGLTGQAGFTNWDRGLLQVAQSSDDYDALLFVTDGNPTAVGDGIRNSEARTTFLEIERGIFSANTVKSEGTKVIGVGILGGTTTDTDVSLNLQAVSGPTLDEDFYLVEDFESLGENLQGLALKSCLSSVSVVKRIVPAGGSLADAAPGAGWTFSASSAAATTPTSATTPESGAVSFTVDLTGAASAPVTITETEKDGFTLIQQDGANAACTRLDNGQPVAVTNDGANGFSVDVLQETGITCDVVNEPPSVTPLAPAITLTKSADVSSVDSVGDVIAYTFVATNTSTANESLSNVTITDPLTGLSPLSCTPAQPATLAVGESLSCTASYPVTQADLDAGAVDNVATVVGTTPSGDEVTASDDFHVPAVPAVAPVPPTTGIAIVKTPSTTEAVPGEDVTYDYLVTNTGTAPLSSVGVADDHCSPVTYVAGDSSGDQRLDVDEQWSFTCTATIEQTTTNVATASGTAPDGGTVSAMDEATVTVPAQEEIPETGGPAWLTAAALSGLVLLVLGGMLAAARRR